MKLVSLNKEELAQQEQEDVKAEAPPQQEEVQAEAQPQAQPNVTTEVVKQDQPLNNNPNVGGFGQAETEVVLQDANRIYGYVAFCFSVIITQTMLVFKKKQFEKVQLAEMNF